jgi:hypothetical protein
MWGLGLDYIQTNQDKMKTYKDSFSIAKYVVIIVIISFTIFGSGCKKENATEVNLGADTTSHNFNWQIDTVGVYQCNLQGIWGTDINNVYAVGFVYFSLNPYVASNIIHWDGSSWKRIDYLEGTLCDIYGFGEKDIWAVGYYSVDNNAYSLIAHWDGKTWITWKLNQYNQLLSVWGTSSTNLYAVGWNGVILHYDGNAWTKQNSGSSSFVLRDIWGLDGNHIFVAGQNESTGEGVILQNDGYSWKTIVKGGINPDSTMLYGDFVSVWGNTSDKLYLVGALSYEGKAGNWRLSDIPYNSPINNITGLSAMRCVRGTSANNVFISGDRELIIHWNGNSWYKYDQFYSKSKQSSLKRIWTKDKNVFIVGYSTSTQALVYRGIQQ